jgi:hypothetical protein
MLNGYKYHVFLSYKHHKRLIKWVTEVEEHLEYFLSNELSDPDTKIFFAPESIEAGDHWPDMLRDGLKTSCCMVAIWEPTYFKSRWCISEWRSFEMRAALIQMQLRQLVVPMKIHRNVPEDAGLIQAADFIDYNTGFWEAFRQSEKALVFEDKLKAFAAIVARVIRNAPTYQDWPIANVPTQAATVIPLETF